jgi:hypothetical protein
MRSENEKGFTDEICHVLGINPPKNTDIVYYKLSAKILLKIAPKLPEWNLKERQNEGPTVSAFIDLAKIMPHAIFGGYIVGKERDDERVSIDTVIFPSTKENAQLAYKTLQPVDKPDEDQTINEKKRWWWD